VIKATGTGREADYWAVGVLICELLVGVTPFASASLNAREVAQRIERCEYNMPSKMPRRAADLMKRLLVVSLPALFFGLRMHWEHCSIFTVYAVAQVLQIVGCIFRPCPFPLRG
jgi:hypothetical protein